MSGFEEAKGLYRRRAELFLSEGADSREAHADAWDRLHQLAEAVDFPLGPSEVQGLLRDLSARVGELYRQETLAAEALQEAAERDLRRAGGL